ncbi:MAG: tryptophan halogenase family protein [Rubripirellula sp.]
MSLQPKSVVIVGGGAAGWITAAMLVRSWREETKITVIESPTVGRVGVGESTIPSIQTLLRFLGIDEHEFIRRTQATFKCTLHLVGWNDGVTQKDGYHPLFGWHEERPEVLEEWACCAGDDPASRPDFCDYFLGVQLARHFKSPKREDDGAHVGAVQYAYHLDAVLMADFLKEWAVQRGVVLVEDNVVAVHRSADGQLASVQTDANGSFASDTFFDCTGFRGLLINEALQERYVSYADDLFCDSAVAIRSYPDWETRNMACETRATALRGGWCWEVPLQTRQGNGYVYSSRELSQSQAEDELLQHLGDVKVSEPRHLKMKVGRVDRAWVKNCLAVGLSAGFVEPLESTSIFAIQFAVSQYLLGLRASDDEAAERDAFNQTNADFYDGIRDFIVAHYCLAGRRDTEFWRENTHRTQLPALLEEVLELWDRGDCLDSFLRNSSSRHLVGPVSWYCVLTSLNRLPGIVKPPHASVDRRFQQRVEDAIQSAKSFPDHRQYFASQSQIFS